MQIEITSFDEISFSAATNKFCFDNPGNWINSNYSTSAVSAVII